MASLLTYQFCSKGSTLYYQGDKTEYFYIVLSGSVGVILFENCIKEKNKSKKNKYNKYAEDRPVF